MYSFNGREPGENIDTLKSLFFIRPDMRKPMPLWFTPIAFLGSSILGGIIIALLFVPILVVGSSVAKAGDDTWNSLPSELPDLYLPQRSYILDVEGNRIATFYSQNRIVTPIRNVSPFIIDAIVATEDERFYQHKGVDGHGLGRALYTNFTSDATEGASTITQQLVKNTLLLAATTDEERAQAVEPTLKRKLHEAHYAMEYEETHTKEEILENYLNTVLFSNGVYGIGTAAQHYFGTSPKNLTLSQSAMLAGLLKNPTGYNPVNHPDAAESRRNLVLNRMLTNGYITQEAYDEAIEEPIELDLTPAPNGCGNSDYPFYCQWVVEQLQDDPRLGATESERNVVLYNGGLEITTPLTPSIQGAAQEEVDKALGRGNRVAAGVSIVEPGTGRVLAMAQNRDWGQDDKETEIILPATPTVQPGSTFKPFTLAAALESGFPANSVMRAPSVFNPSDMNVPDGGIKNLASHGSGLLTINEATALSSNTYYAELARRTGVLTVAEMAKSLGISVPNNVTSRDASFTLGTTESSPLEMSAAFAAFASGGLYCAPTGIDTITDLRNGTEFEGEPTECYQAMSKSTASRVTEALTGVIDGEEQWRTGREASIDRPAGGKTGSTTRHAAAWFVGFTPQMSTAVWLGDPRGGFAYPLTGGINYYGRTQYDVYASDVAIPIWRNIMRDVHKDLDVENFDFSSSGSPVGTRIVPDVSGMTAESAVGILEAQGFTVEFEKEFAEPRAGVSPGVVMDQTPDGSQSVFNVTAVTVRLTLSDGSVIPDYGEEMDN